VNELPYKDRRKHTLLVAMWSGAGKPKFASFLKDFVEQCNRLVTDGITWTHRGQEITSKVFFTKVCADSGARCYLQGIKQFNGFHSCHWCHIPGENCQLESGGHKLVFPPSSGEHEPRTAELFIEHLVQLDEQRDNGRADDVFGINSFSPFADLQGFNIVDGMSVDYMHTGLLGVLRSFTSMFIDSKNHLKPYYINTTNQAEVIDRLKRVKVPYEVNRSTRGIGEIAHWKANEWKTWLLVSLPVLKVRCGTNPPPA
jgi:hypothetical protein